MIALFHNSPVLEDENNIRVLNSGESVSNNKCGSALGQSFQCPLYQGFGLLIESRCGFIQYQNRAVQEKHTGHGNPLEFSTGEGDALFPDSGMVAIR